MVLRTSHSEHLGTSRYKSMTLWVSVPVVYTNYFQFSWPSVIAIAFVSAHFEAWDKGIVDYHCCVDMSEYSVQCMEKLRISKWSKADPKSRSFSKPQMYGCRGSEEGMTLWSGLLVKTKMIWRRKLWLSGQSWLVVITQKMCLIVMKLLFYRASPDRFPCPSLRTVMAQKAQKTGFPCSFPAALQGKKVWNHL